jgi:hypothetical protein
MRRINDMDKPIDIIERGAEDMQGIATAITGPSCRSRVTGDPSNAASATAAMLLDSIGILIPLAK